ncbi:matrixin family metalloprotease [Bacillus pinisoli]
MIHEMGHILGLSHEDYLKSVMIGKGWCNCLSPQTDDYNGINAVYP